MQRLLPLAVVITALLSTTAKIQLLPEVFVAQAVVLCTVMPRVDFDSLTMTAKLQSIFRFSNGSGQPWMMMCVFDTNGHCRRYFMESSSEDPWEYTVEQIDEAYFRQDWYYVPGPGQCRWAIGVKSLLARYFQEALTHVALYYLPWFESIFMRYPRNVRKRFSYYGAIGGEHGRDLGNKVYSVVVSAAFRIRAQRGLPVLQCENITSLEGRGDIIETLLGCVWRYEEMAGDIDKNLMYARTALEAACLGVEIIWEDLHWRADQFTLVQAALDAPNFVVGVPPPGASSYAQQDRAWMRHQALVERRDRFKLALGLKFGVLVRNLIDSYL
jgi:hypothetical protein